MRPAQALIDARPGRRERLEEWRARRAEVLTPGDPAAIERQLGRGKLLARERIEQLLDPGSFQELRMMAYTAENPLLAGKQADGDGIVAGWGTVDGRRIFVFSQDATVMGGSLGEIGGTKVHKVLDLAVEAGVPVVGILDGGGARIQEGVASLVAFGGIFRRNTRASGVVPQLSLIMGTATGGAVYSPALTDFVFMVDGTATMAITGPKVIKEVTGEDVTLEELGGAAVHARASGVVHFVVPDEAGCLDQARRLLGFLPSSHRNRPPVTASRPPAGGSNGWDPFEALPDDLDAPYDVHEVIAAIVDGGELLEYAPGWGPAVVCGFARLDGRSVGIVAGQPAADRGRFDIDACDKAARFVRTCDAFNVPLVTIVDSPGFATGLADHDPGRRYRLVRAAAKLLSARAEADVPRVTLVIGRAHEPAAADVCLAWPTADLAGSTAWDAARRGVVDRVIEPHETRTALIEALAVLTDLERPPLPRKHENLPL